MISEKKIIHLLYLPHQTWILPTYNIFSYSLHSILCYFFPNRNQLSFLQAPADIIPLIFSLYLPSGTFISFFFLLLSFKVLGQFASGSDIWASFVIRALFVKNFFSKLSLAQTSEVDRNGLMSDFIIFEESRSWLPTKFILADFFVQG